jgi:AcrR family transcriptional regulator
MKTEYRFAEALKEMMSEVSLDSISVTSLCKKCKVNRQTFYYHFHDIYDLLALVFLN